MAEVTFDTATLTTIEVGWVHVQCPQCETYNHALAVGVRPVLIGDEIVMIGDLFYWDCGCLFSCRHLATRCAVLLENFEAGSLVAEDLCHLVRADHED